MLVMETILTLITNVVPRVVNLFAKRHANIQIVLNKFERNGSLVTIKNIGGCAAENITILLSSQSCCYWDICSTDTNQLIINRLHPQEQQNYIIITPIVGQGEDVVFSISWSDKSKKSRKKMSSIRLYSVDGCL